VQEDPPIGNPRVVLDLIEAFRRSKTMFAAVSLGVFDALQSGPKSLSTLATMLEVNSDALERLLDACAGLELLVRDEDLYANTRGASLYLGAHSPARITGYINYSNQVLWKLWGNLEDAIREGTNRWQQTFGWDGPIFSNFFRTEAAMHEFLMGMHGQGLLSSPHVVAAFDLSRFHCLVDLGGATGHLAIAACRRYPSLRAVVFDLPQVLELARTTIASSGFADRVQTAAGDFFADVLPEGDIYALGRILHDWSAAKIRALLMRIFQRLPSGGALLIAEKLLSADKTGPSWAQMQDLNMLLCTEGRERTLAEYETLLKEVGFAAVLGHSTPSTLDAVLAVKA
jgi:acetylserotonin N-methyltransferase